MTQRRPCDDVRREILAFGPLGNGPLGNAPRTHLAECRACRLFAARLAIVDDGLESDAERAAASTLPASLRARILGATRPGLRAVPPPVRRARWSDLAVRAAAVAAVLVGAVAVLPAPALAEDESIDGLFGIRAALSQPVELPLLPRTISLVGDRGTTTGATSTTAALAVNVAPGAEAMLLPLAAGAIALFAAGLVLRRRP